MEEKYLIKFFGDEYREYQKNVPIRIPFIKGYIEGPKEPYEPEILKKS